MDDGSQATHESLQMLTLESEQGAQEILLTPHFYAHFDKISSFLERGSLLFSGNWGCEANSRTHD